MSRSASVDGTELPPLEKQKSAVLADKRSRSVESTQLLNSVSRVRLDLTKYLVACVCTAVMWLKYKVYLKILYWMRRFSRIYTVCLI